MKQNTYKTLSLLMLMLAILLTGCGSDDPVFVDPTDDDDPDEVELVEFPDGLLEAQIRLALDIDSDEDITPELMLTLEELNIDASDDFSGELSDISNLTGLQYAENLTFLRLSYTSVTDLSPISDLENIEYLRFNNTAITDISPISGYTSLTYFNANTVTGLEDISPLAGNENLQTAILRNVPFGNEGMTTIRELTSLHRINMRNTGVTDITVLGELMAEGALLDSTPGAEENGGADLDLRQLDIEDWSPIEPYLDQISNLDGYPGD
ncbi:leucine-rich repeat domain-containing protein [Rhodohalobacter sp. SW132]|nr:leucine-rich repeat domain-containing protein [Rhodohalobacter sp. SW132]